MNHPLLEVSNLRIAFSDAKASVSAVNEISYRLERGEALGIVGESGSGKTVHSYALLGLLPPPGRITGGALSFEGADLQEPAVLRRLRGKRIGMVFQDPGSSLNPFYTVGRQLMEAGGGALPTRGSAARRARALSLLEDLGIPDAKACMKRYTHELSGGQQQRVMLAIALMDEPDLLIADEPTTALDVSTQAQILSLLRRLQTERGLSILFITHNLAVVAELCQRLLVMYAGMILEEGLVSELFAQAAHPYTQGLLRSIPSLLQRETLSCIPGSPPDLAALPPGCPFAPRCAHVMPLCTRQRPPLTELSPTHRAACHLLRAEAGKESAGV